MKYIVVTGGVLSGIGKGIAAASVGALLKGMGYSVFCQKFDGYLNVDPGTMSPFQHGEVFVTDDGAETDLDLGHYERFLDTSLNTFSSFTSGRLYEELILRERRGDFLGGTVQIVPHLTNLVKEKIHEGAKISGADISIIEIGGTIGDMENEYFLESVRQLQHEVGRENVIFAHVVLLPYLGASKELKSKPIQHSVRAMMGYGLTPDLLIVRADSEIPEEMMQKVAASCGLDRYQVVAAPTLDSIYRVPLAFADSGLCATLTKILSLDHDRSCDLSGWRTLVENIDASTEEIRIGMIGKYNDLEDAYLSLNEGLKTAGFAYQKKVKLVFIDAEELESDTGSGSPLSGTGMGMGEIKQTPLPPLTGGLPNQETNTPPLTPPNLWGEGNKLKDLDAICIPGGFGSRGIEGMIRAAQYARENRVPYLGVCLGSQIMAIEFARNVLGITDANSEEFTPEGAHNIVHIMEHQKGLTTKGGNMRLGSYPCVIRAGTLAEKVYGFGSPLGGGVRGGFGQLSIEERHRHRFEFDPSYRAIMEEKGFIVSATSPDGQLAEIVEIADHPYMIATQAHPEFLSRPTRPHPLFMGLIEACMK